MLALDPSPNLASVVTPLRASGNKTPIPAILAILASPVPSARPYKASNSANHSDFCAVRSLVHISSGFRVQGSPTAPVCRSKSNDVVSGVTPSIRIKVALDVVAIVSSRICNRVHAKKGYIRRGGRCEYDE